MGRSDFEFVSAGTRNVATVAAAATVTLILVGPLGVSVPGLTEQLRPGLKLLQLKLTALLNPLIGVRVTRNDAVLPTVTTLAVPACADREKSAEALLITWLRGAD